MNYFYSNSEKKARKNNRATSGFFFRNLCFIYMYENPTALKSLILRELKTKIPSEKIRTFLRSSIHRRKLVLRGK